MVSLYLIIKSATPFLVAVIFKTTPTLMHFGAMCTWFWYVRSCPNQLLPFLFVQLYQHTLKPLHTNFKLLPEVHIFLQILPYYIIIYSRVTIGHVSQSEGQRKGKLLCQIGHGIYCQVYSACQKPRQHHQMQSHERKHFQNHVVTNSFSMEKHGSVITWHAC